MKVPSSLAVIGRQLMQWPPTSSTITGAAILIFLAAFESAGGFGQLKISFPAGLGAMAAFAHLCPQASPQVAKLTEAAKAAETLAAQLDPPAAVAVVLPVAAPEAVPPAAPAAAS